MRNWTFERQRGQRGPRLSFAYDPYFPRRTSMIDGSGTTQYNYPPGVLTQTASYNNLNQLTNQSGQALTWDADGNLLSDGARTYTWDAENRLVGISYPGQTGKAIAFAYDGLGRRVMISSTPAGGSATVTSFIWCGLHPCQERNSSNSVMRAYYDEGEAVTLPSAIAHYYGLDRVNSVRRVFHSIGTQSVLDYDPYGNVLDNQDRRTDYGYADTFYRRCMARASLIFKECLNGGPELLPWSDKNEDGWAPPRAPKR